MLARLFQADYPVPDGFVVLPAAFQKRAALNTQAWRQVKMPLQTLRENRADAQFAVRSSAINEDSAGASFSAAC